MYIWDSNQGGEWDEFREETITEREKTVQSETVTDAHSTMPTAVDGESILDGTDAGAEEMSTTVY